MFNEEEFIKNYIEALKTGEDAEGKLTALTSGLPQDESSAFYTDIIRNIIKELKKTGDAHEAEIKRLENTIAMMNFMEELAEQDSNTEEAKDNTEAVEVTQDVAAGSVAVASEGEVAVEETAANSKEEADGEAPTEEVKAEKTEA